MNALHFIERGQGPRTILVLHGFLGSGRNLGALVRTWVDRDPKVRLLMPDLPGHGLSPGLDKSDAAEQMADAIFAFGEARTAGPPYEIVGHSMGGRVGLLMHQHRPNAIKSLVLLDVSPAPIQRVSESEIEELLEALLNAPSETKDRATMKTFLQENSALSERTVSWLLMNLDCDRERCGWRIDRKRLANARRETRARDLWPEKLGGLKLGCVYGARSSFVSSSARDRLLNLGAQVLEIKNAGHNLHVEQTNAVADAVDQILR